MLVEPTRSHGRTEGMVVALTCLRARMSIVDSRSLQCEQGRFVVSLDSDIKPLLLRSQFRPTSGPITSLPRLLVSHEMVKATLPPLPEPASSGRLSTCVAGQLTQGATLLVSMDIYVSSESRLSVQVSVLLVPAAR